MKLKKSLLALSLAAFAASASAGTIVNHDRLQDGLNSATEGGTFNQDVTSAQYQYTPSETWTLDALSIGNALMMFEVAGFATTNTMGIYDLGSNATLELFNGAAATGDSARLNQNGNTFTATYFDENGALMPNAQSSSVFTGSNFGFYLTTPQNNTFYSQAALNGDSDSDGIDDVHMLAFQGDGSQKMDANNDGNYKPFTSNNFILAWEDLVLNGSDRDYADMVVMVESFLPVPEPGTLALLGLGLAGLGAARRRQKA